MDNQAFAYFQALTRDREENAAVLEKASMRGVQKSVVDKYSEQAHFVYELIQNADDAGATYARFVLKENELVFAHNGMRQFTVSNPATEDEDRKNGQLGDVNAITSIANSNKTEASIGKFGVGFKAVFQYTTTPRIYCPSIAFRIERFIVPQLLNGDHMDRSDDETLFVFPFDRDDMNPSRAVKEIGERLASLAYPVLFLNSLEKVFYVTPSTRGEYSENEIETYYRGDVKATLISFRTAKGETEINEPLWMLSSIGQSGHTSTVCFFLDEDGRLTPKQVPAYCFFPTAVNTGLAFMVNAPFLLTDSREGIKLGDPHNKRLAKELGKLTGDALLTLRDIGIDTNRRIIDANLFDVIPYKPQSFWSFREAELLFNPIVDSIRSVLRYQSIFPSESGYWTARSSYLMENAPIARIFDERHLRQLVGNSAAGLIMPGIYSVNMETGLTRYLQSIGVTVVNEQFVFNRLSTAFIADQTVEWLGILHGYLAETDRRIKSAKQRAVFVDSDGNACAAYDEHDRELLFLPSADSEGYHVLASESLEQDGTRRLATALKLQEPSLGDKVFSKVLPSLCSEANARNQDAFKTLFRYYIESDESASFLHSLAEYSFIAHVSYGRKQLYGARPDELYFPFEHVKDYFRHTRSARFVDLDFYLGFIEDQQRLIGFFRRLGIVETPKLVTRSLNDLEAKELTAKTGVQWDRYTVNRKHTWNERCLDGLDDALEYLSRNEDPDYSLAVWNTLVSFVDMQCGNRSIASILSGTFSYHYYHPQTQNYEPLTIYRLRHAEWLYDRLGNSIAPLGYDVTGISERYPTSGEAAEKLVEFLGLEEPKPYEMSDGDRLAASLDETARLFGSSFDELKNDPEIGDAIKRAIAETLRARNAQVEIPDKAVTEAHDHLLVEFNNKTDGPEVVSESEELAVQGSAAVPPSTNRQYQGQSTEGRPIGVRRASEESDDAPTRRTEAAEFSQGRRYADLSRTAGDIEKRAAKRREMRQASADGQASTQDDTNAEQNYEQPDADEYMPATEDYERSSERLKNRYARDIDTLARQETLWNAAVEAETYSYKWFKCLIELEQLSDASTDSTRMEFVISFGSVRLEEGTSRTLVLEQPSRDIPQSIEEQSNIPMALEYDGITRSVEIEVASVKSYTLRVKLKDGTDLSGVELDKVYEARIEVRNPTFLLEELRKRYLGLNLKDNYNMRDTLPGNIEFVFGPPGTGKTTHLAREVLLPLMSGEEDIKVLVLAPTNKAADVLARKIIEQSGGVEDCVPWLVRFGTTLDDYLETTGIHRDKTFDYSALARSVTITTIARYPYDYFMTDDGHDYIRNMEWDYVVIDEASMITCAYITYVLHTAKPRSFIIAGDPHQIEPVAKVNLWKDENIYTMTGLKSFVNPKTQPHDYKVTLLNTQYRSVPAIGMVFSNYSYGGALSHYRRDSSALRSCLGGLFGRQPINLIRFPVSKYESIYKPKHLRGGSSYQPYSALLTFELVRYLSKLLAARKQKASIGVVSPYKAQANLIQGLIAQTVLPSGIDVQTGTIHGFQGDECDVMMVVLNPPPRISTSREMFLNKRNILNVSVSRARDSLIMLVPDESAPDRSKLVEVNRIERICRGTKLLSEYTSAEVEEMIFCEREFIANNSFTTGHQPVNVYGLPEQRYEIRSEEQAVDIQLHESATGS